MQLTKLNKGNYIGLTINAESRQEAIDWRNHFFNWGVITIGRKHSIPTLGLDDQEKQIAKFEEKTITDDGRIVPTGRTIFKLQFFVSKKKLINHFANQEEIWPAGGRLRKLEPVRERVKREAMEKARQKFDNIPTESVYGQGE